MGLPKDVFKSRPDNFQPFFAQNMKALQAPDTTAVPGSFLLASDSVDISVPQGVTVAIACDITGLATLYSGGGYVPFTGNWYFPNLTLVFKDGSGKIITRVPVVINTVVDAANAVTSYQGFPQGQTFDVSATAAAVPLAAWVYRAMSTQFDQYQTSVAPEQEIIFCYGNHFLRGYWANDPSSHIRGAKNVNMEFATVTLYADYLLAAGHTAGWFAGIGIAAIGI